MNLQRDALKELVEMIGQGAAGEKALPAEAEVHTRWASLLEDRKTMGVPPADFTWQDVAAHDAARGEELGKGFQRRGSAVSGAKKQAAGLPMSRAADFPWPQGLTWGGIGLEEPDNDAEDEEPEEDGGGSGSEGGGGSGSEGGGGNEGGLSEALAAAPCARPLDGTWCAAWVLSADAAAASITLPRYMVAGQWRDWADMYHLARHTPGGVFVEQAAADGYAYRYLSLAQIVANRGANAQQPLNNMQEL
jgi:hypothetical protein